MPADEDIEKVRQEVMRFHELLTIMRQKLEEGERAYAQLFSGFSAEDLNGLKEKAQQWKAAERLITDVTPLRTAAMHMRFETRNLEHAFEELYDVIVSD